MFLLNELLKKEVGHSNIFNASVDEVMPFCKKMIGFDEKNFKKVLSQYRRRDDIVLDTENARTTHIGFNAHFYRCRIVVIRDQYQKF